MHSFTAVVLASLLSVSSASPLLPRTNTCGAAPAGSADNKPLSQPSGVQKASDCQAQCTANSQCQSFCFGLVDNEIQCKLYACAASAIPTQSSTNLVAYDKACSAVPSVTPTASNPQGFDFTKTNGQKAAENNGQQKQSPSPSPVAQQNKQVVSGDYNNQGAADNNAQPKNSPTPSPAKANGQPAQSPAAQGNNAQPKQSPAAQAGNAQPKQSQAAQPAQSQKSYGSTSNTQGQTIDKSKADTCAQKPSGTTSNAPISSPSVSSADACKTQCQNEANCQSFSCGTADNTFVCQLFSCAASAIPTPSTTAQKNALVAYDVGCSI